MNLCKRACLYSIRKKGKTLTLLIFLLVMATLMLTCLSVQSATETAGANIKKALLGYFTINAKTLENGIPEDTVSQILAMDGPCAPTPTLLILTRMGTVLRSTPRALPRYRKVTRTPGKSWPTPILKMTATSQMAALRWWKAAPSPPKRLARC